MEKKERLSLYPEKQDQSSIPQKDKWLVALGIVFKVKQVVCTERK